MPASGASEGSMGGLVRQGKPGRLEDTLLIDMYAETNHIAREAAKAYVTQYLAELKSILEERKTIVLPGLGRLRATRENTFFFVADEGLDIFPAGVGLEPVSLKTHSLQEEPVVIDVPVPTIEDVPQPVEVPEPAEAEESPYMSYCRLLTSSLRTE